MLRREGIDRPLLRDSRVRHDDALFGLDRRGDTVEISELRDIPWNGRHAGADQCLRLVQLGLSSAGDEDVRRPRRQPLPWSPDRCRCSRR